MVGVWGKLLRSLTVNPVDTVSRIKGAPCNAYYDVQVCTCFVSMNKQGERGAEEDTHRHSKDKHRFPEVFQDNEVHPYKPFV